MFELFNKKKNNTKELIKTALPISLVISGMIILTQSITIYSQAGWIGAIMFVTFGLLILWAGITLINKWNK